MLGPHDGGAPNGFGLQASSRAEGVGLINLESIDEGRRVHTGFVAGRYRNSALSDQWTDVDRCAVGTFIGYVPVCSCGWSGAERAATPTGLRACRQALSVEHC